MIRSIHELKAYEESDNHFLIPNGWKERVIAHCAAYPMRSIRKYLRCLRRQEYYINTAKGSRIKGLLGLLYERKKNRLGMLLGIEIGPNCFGKGLSIWHAGSIVVNPDARIGENCTLHGANCIGNNGKGKGVPRIGDHVDIGYGAVIIGNIEIADHVTIGANAVVNKSVTEPGCTVAGVPAKVIRRK